KALPAPEDDAYVRHVYEPPQGETEQTLASIWEELLGVDKVGRNDNFFELGGNSLMAVRLLSRLQSSLNVNIELSKIYNNQALKHFAKEVLISLVMQEFDQDDLLGFISMEDSK
ncbi:phosphopantetheine-binding protein, partial [Oleiagrimonas sp. MCCC 1A03011]|uniref:phosphopantetheine-binding protein n=1 Tax=Oleiagrimonas sp. MCCC 1A03011 TaxID=1926883 RepID=UPI000DC22723